MPRSPHTVYCYECQALSHGNWATLMDVYLPCSSETVDFKSGAINYVSKICLGRRTEPIPSTFPCLMRNHIANVFYIRYMAASRSFSSTNGNIKNWDYGECLVSTWSKFYGPFLTGSLVVNLENHCESAQAWEGSIPSQAGLEED
jgi:hypothetical protein